jgi:hypothetical protein
MGDKNIIDDLIQQVDNMDKTSQRATVLIRGLSDYILDNVYDPATLKALAKKLEVSAKTLAEVIAKNTGQ